MIELLKHLDEIHTTPMGYERIKKNLNVNLDHEGIISLCKERILDKNSHLYQKGKNRYCEIEGMIITINAHSYTIITAHQY